MPQQTLVLFHSLTPFKGNAALASLPANLDRSTGAQRNGRSVFSYLSTVAAVAALVVACAVLAACAGNSGPKASAPVITTNPTSMTVTAGAAADD